ncbi:MAG: polysaccharide deacetylase family protein [Candidatus Riflebacteria bacterium]|nr:polysaccharide deacetylase family protein [Candidatus Riflebacteria bacterium]
MKPRGDALIKAMVQFNLRFFSVCFVFMFHVFCPVQADEPVFQREVAITMDDLNMNANDCPLFSLSQRNQAILRALKKHNDLRAAIFVRGKLVDSEFGKETLKVWNDAGHMIGNHSYSHFCYSGTTFEKFSLDILANETIVKAYSNYRPIFRFPYLKEGETREKRDKLRKFFKNHNYRHGYVTIDASDWAIDDRLRKHLKLFPNSNLDIYKKFYLDHITKRAAYYEELARKVFGRPIKHTLLIHHSLLNALFLDDLLSELEKKGWKLINAEDAFKDPVFSIEPDIIPAGESIVWAKAKESGKFESILRYPAEDEVYEQPEMDKLGL